MCRFSSVAFNRARKKHVSKNNDRDIPYKSPCYEAQYGRDIPIKCLCLCAFWVPNSRIESR